MRSKKFQECAIKKSKRRSNFNRYKKSWNSKMRL